MYGVKVGETLVRVVAKEDAMALVSILFELDCADRISSKPMLETVEEEKE